MVVRDIWRGMTGLDLHEEVRARSLQASVIIITRRIDPGATNKTSNTGALAFFKPFAKQEFLSAARSALQDRA